jgi:hypothetical protein
MEVGGRARLERNTRGQLTVSGVEAHSAPSPLAPKCNIARFGIFVAALNRETSMFAGEAIMSSLEISLVTTAVVFGGALLGIALRAVLPQSQLGGESREVVKLGVGLIATMAALVLGLLIASAKSSFDTQSVELTDMSSKIVLLDSILAHYGPDAKEARAVLRGSVVGALDSLSTEPIAVRSQSGSSSNGEVLYDQIQGLSPKDDAQRSMQVQALSIMVGVGQTRRLLAAQKGNSVSGAIFLILELYSPYAGLIHVSGAPLRAALAHLGQ